MSECFCWVTALEIAYAGASENMRSIVMAILLFSALGIPQAIVLAVMPVIKDPYLIWAWAGPGILLFVLSLIFHWRYRWMNFDEFMLRGDDDE
jgi:proton-dependent oligopeptide transporter, POT family